MQYEKVYLEFAALDKWRDTGREYKYTEAKKLYGW